MDQSDKVRSKDILKIYCKLLKHNKDVIFLKDYIFK
jgi:hypothetical protein